MPSYYRGARDEYGNRDYARRDAYADSYYGPHDERGSAPPDDAWYTQEEAEERNPRERYERRYEYPAREDYRYMPEDGGERGYGLDEYGRGPEGYGVDREYGPPPEDVRPPWQEPHWAHRDVRSGYGYFREPPRAYPRHPEELPRFGAELRYHASHPPEPWRPPPPRRRWR